MQISRQATPIQLLEQGKSVLVNSVSAPHLEDAAAKFKARVVVRNRIEKPLDGAQTGDGIEIAPQGDINLIGSRQTIDIDYGH